MGEIASREHRSEQENMEALHQHLACALPPCEVPHLQLLAGSVQWTIGAWKCRYERRPVWRRGMWLGFSAVRECGEVVQGFKRLDQLEAAIQAHEDALIARHDEQLADTAFEAGWPGDVRCM